MFKASVQVIF